MLWPQLQVRVSANEKLSRKDVPSWKGIDPFRLEVKHIVDHLAERRDNGIGKIGEVVALVRQWRDTVI